MELSDEMLTEISYVQISKYREKVMKSLDGDVKIPTAIAKDSGIRTNHISKVLSELKAHELCENNQPINHEVLSNIMVELYNKYYGLDITKEEVKKYVWAYIPHLFYTPFYVYQYATSFSASFKLYKDVSENVEGAMDRYVNLLKSGGSKYPVEQAKEAGVDFMQKETFMAVIDRMNELVEKLEELLK